MTVDVNAQEPLGVQLRLNAHEIRETERRIGVARRRRMWSKVSLIFGPTLVLVLYSILWISYVPRIVIIAVYPPAVLISAAFFVAWYRLTRHPGGPPDGRGKRLSEGELELELAGHRDARKLLLADEDIDIMLRRVEYKEDAYGEIDKLRLESNRYRRVNNLLQGVIIVGSLAATGASGVSGNFPPLRWVVLGVTFTVGISSGFMGYFKYKERSFYLQQTADAIEQEWEAVEVGVGRYKRIESEADKLAEFVEEVHRLKSEQKKRQQNLEQPADARGSNE